MSGGGPPSEEQRAAMREKFEGLQKEIDVHYFALRALLTPEQQAKLDALPRPRVAMMGPRRPGRS
jgi:Spy/CpxP family protein refolding chaperone